MSLPRVVTRSAAVAAGVSERVIDRRLARGLWTRLHPGVYFTVGPEPAYRDRLEGAVLAGGPGAALSGSAALTLWTLRDVAPPTRPLVLTTPRAGAASTDSVRLRRTTVPYTARVVAGVRTAGVARALADHCLEVRRLATVQAVLSEAVRRGLCTADEIARAYRLGPQRGSRNLRIALEDVALGAWSVPEAVVGRALRIAGLPVFEQNAAILDADGRIIARADVYWRQWRAAVEIDGAEVHSSAHDWAQTMRRSARLGALGITVLHIAAADVLRNPDHVVAQIRDWLAHVQARSRSRPPAA